MKITCLQENLKKGLITTERIIGKNLTLPILNNILIKTDKGRLKLSSTNLEIGVNYWLSGKIEREGEITVPAKVISNFVNNLPNKKIELETKDNVLFVFCDGYKAKIQGQPVTEFPIIPTVQPKSTSILEYKSLKEALSQVVDVAAISESRPEISGILFVFSKNNIKFVATDSFRLAEKIVFNKNNFEESVIVPQKTVQELLRVLSEKIEFKEDEGLVKIVIGANQIMFDLDHIQLISRLIEGQYPDYQQIIPKQSKTKIFLLREEIIKAVKIASFFSSKINDIRLSINTQKQFIEVSSQNVDIGENKCQLNAEIEGDPLEIAFNWRYLLDGFVNIKTDKLFFGFNGDSNPSILKPLGDESYLYVVMPIKVI